MGREGGNGKSWGPSASLPACFALPPLESMEVEKNLLTLPFISLSFSFGFESTHPLLLRADPYSARAQGLLDLKAQPCMKKTHGP